MKLHSVEIFKELVINKKTDLLIDRFECLIIDKCQNN